MKKSLLPILILFLLAGTGLMAQDYKVTSGQVDYNQGEFCKAVKTLDQALAKVNDLKEKNVPKAYYYRGVSRIKCLGELAQKGDTATLSKMTDAPILAYEDLKKAKETDVANKWGKKVDGQMILVNQSLLTAGVGFLNATFKGGVGEDGKKQLRNEVIKYMTACAEITPTSYVPLDVRAQAYLGLGDSASALKDFRKAGSLFEANKPKNPDQLVAYVFYRLSMLERYYNRDLKASLQAITKGKELLDGEHAKIMKMDLQPDAKAKMEEQYQNANADLSNIELDILLNSPDMLNEALSKFETAIEKDPKNYIKHVAFAQLLEKVDFDRAVGMYKKAITVDDKKHMAHFNLGALYVNKAVEKYKAANEISDDMTKADALQEEGNKLFKEAIPHLKNAQKLEPCDQETLKALLQIFINLNMTEEYTTYKDIKKGCG